MARALAKEGRAQFTGKKAATTGCPGCCGPGTPGCCFCGDADAVKGDPCYVGIENFPPESLCTPVRSCCCGSKFRVTFTRKSKSRKATVHGGYVAPVDETEFSEKYVREFTIVENEDGSCSVSVVDISYHGTFRRFGVDKFQIPYDDTETRNDFPFAHQRFLSIMDASHALCRTEPVQLADRSLLSTMYEEERPFTANTWNVLFLTGCSDTKSYDNESGLSYSDTWTGLGGCKTARLTGDGEYLYDFTNPGFPKQYIEQTRHQEAEVLVETLVDNCCPDEPGTPGTPYNPAPPLIPVDPDNPGLGYLCPRCGLKMTGDKCRNCNFCNGCGG